MKDIQLNGLSGILPVEGGTAEWYYAMDYTAGDLYEAEELAARGGTVPETRFYLVRYPDGEVLRPLPQRPGLVFGRPVYYDQVISVPGVDFAAGQIHIYRFDCRAGTLDEAAVLPLSGVKDCYNLMLHEHPLTLTRQPNDSTFELIWPVRRTFAIGPTETFYFRDGDRLFFTAWYEDPDYREETIIRDASTGQILERLPGDTLIMPNGEIWHLF